MISRCKIPKNILWLGLIPLSIWFVCHYQFSWNKTESLPQKLFIIKTGKLPTKYDYVMFYAPSTSTLKADDTIIKKVMGISGDIVTRKGQDFYINGKKMGIAKTHSLKGRFLQPGTVGTIPCGKYFVWTPHLDSYDSRYAEIGWIDESNIIGVAYPIF
jgi:conjugal transfer pilin signal peptidase TrbI